MMNAIVINSRLVLLAIVYLTALLRFDQVKATPVVPTQTRGGALAGSYGISYDMLRQHASPRCPQGFQKEPQHVRRCFKVVLIKATWIAAKGYCEAMDSVLAEVTSTEEQNFLADEIKSQLFWRPALKAQRHQFWLGATDLAFEGQWRWLAGNRPIDGASYTNWGSRQPDMKRQHEHCMAARANAKGAEYKWHDINCNKQNYFICFKKLDS